MGYQPRSGMPEHVALPNSGIPTRSGMPEHVALPNSGIPTRSGMPEHVALPNRREGKWRRKKDERFQPSCRRAEILVCLMCRFIGDDCVWRLGCSRKPSLRLAAPRPNSTNLIVHAAPRKAARMRMEAGRATSGQACGIQRQEVDREVREDRKETLDNLEL